MSSSSVTNSLKAREERKGRFNYDFAAVVLAEAMFYGDPRAAHRNGITTQSVGRYRERMQTDDELLGLYVEKCKLVRDSWKQDIGRFLAKALDTLERACDEVDVKNPATITALADAMKTVAEIKIVTEIVDARIRLYASGADAEEVGYLASAAPEYAANEVT